MQSTLFAATRIRWIRMSFGPYWKTHQWNEGGSGGTSIWTGCGAQGQNCRTEKKNRSLMKNKMLVSISPARIPLLPAIQISWLCCILPFRPVCLRQRKYLFYCPWLGFRYLRLCIFRQDGCMPREKICTPWFREEWRTDPRQPFFRLWRVFRRL